MTRRLNLAWSDVAWTTVRRMLLAWKNAHRFEASTFLLIDSVCAPLPSVSDSARNNAITAINSAIFLFSPDACSACSACSMLSWALMILSPARSLNDGPNDTTSARARPRGRSSSECENWPISGAGMRRFVHFQEPFAVDPGINLRGRERSVAEQFLDRAQIAAAGQKMGCEGMSQRMRRRAVG